MKNFKAIFGVLLLLILPFAMLAKDSQSSYKFTKKGLVKTTIHSDSIVQQLTVLKPILIFKGKYELDTESGDSQFSIKNARVGVQGDVTKQISYKFMVDLSDNGSFKVLDLYATFKPAKGLKFTFGQGGIPLFNSYTVSPNSTDFVNRPFIGKFFNSSRDIGLTAAYTIKQKGFPIAVEAGVFNGDGINNPQFTDSPAFGGRILFGSMEGFRATAKFYKTAISEDEDYLMWGADLRYDNSLFRFETEFMNKYNYSDFDAYQGNLSSAYAQGLVKIPVNSNTFKRFEPAFRWDAMGYDILDRGFGVNRATVGINFVLNTNNFTSLFRVNYEHYFRSSMNMSKLFKSGTADDNKLSLEFLLVF